jgi:hypothetical protein
MYTSKHAPTKGFSVATAEIFIMEPKGKKSLESETGQLVEELTLLNTG